MPEEGIGAANYSLVGAAEDEDEEHVESEAEPGYATVARHTGTASRSHSGVVVVEGGGRGGGQVERSRDDVGDDGYNHLSVEDRPRLATPRHEQPMTEQQDIGASSGPHYDDPRTGAGLPSTPHIRERDGHDENRSLSPISRQAGELGGAAHSYDSIDNPAMLPRNGIQPRAYERGEQSGQQLRVPPQQQQVETLYSKVIKPKNQEDKGHQGRSSRSRDVVATASGHLPPIAPHSSPPNRRRGGEREMSRDIPRGNVKKMSSPRDSSSPHQHQHRKSRSHASSSHNADSQHHVVNSSGIHHHSETGGGGRVRTKSSSKGRSRSYSMPIEAHDPNISTQSTHQQRRHRSESYSHTTQPPPPPTMEEYFYEEEDDIDLPIEYTDESYLGEESETFTCTESYFHDLYGELEQEGDIPGDYVDGSHVTPNRRHRRSRSATYPGHLEPHQTVSKKRASSPHAAYYSSGHNRSPPQKRRKRPASSGEVPFLRPPALQPVYPISQNQVYVFSEMQPDGSVQYYSATPVNSPPIISPPPRFNAPSPLQQSLPNSVPPTTTQLQVPPTITPRSPHPTQATVNTHPQQRSVSPSAMNMTPSPHKNVRVEQDGGTFGATAHARAGLSSPLVDQAKFSRKVPMGITESGYFSSAPVASSQQGLAAMGQVPPISVQQERASTSGGLPQMANPSSQEVQQNTHLSPSPNLHVHVQSDESYHCDDQQLTFESPRSGRRSKSPQMGPTAKLLESSLQAANVSSRSLSPTTKSPRDIKSSKSPRLNASLDSRTATQNLAGTTALYEQKERVLKARIKALEDSTVELCTENAGLKQLCETLKQDASKSDSIHVHSPLYFSFRELSISTCVNAYHIPSS